MDPSDEELLERFGHANDQGAFAALVRRHLNLVYSVARRQVASPQLAEEVAQSVFADLAAQARGGLRPIPLGAWLYVVARRAGIDAARSESRRRVREQAAFELSTMNPPSPTWARIEPLLDEAMAALSDPDRGAIVLRYLENRSLREVGAALGTSENAAQKRVSRGLEQLRSFFARRGVPISVGALAADLARHSLEAAPAALAGTIAATGTTTTAALTATLAMTTVQKTLLTAAAVAALAGIGYQASANAGLRADLIREQDALRETRMREQRLRTDHADLLRRQAAVSPAPAAAPPSPAPLVEDSRRETGLPVILRDTSTLAEPFVQALKLSEPEQEAVLSALNRAREKMNELELAHATLSDRPDGTLVITIPPFAGGEAVYDELMASLKETLGDERMRTFDDRYHGDGLSLTLGNFGAGTRKLTIARVPPNFAGDLPGGARLAPTASGGFFVAESTRTPNAFGIDKMGLVTDIATRPILKPFAERLNAMPFYQGMPAAGRD